MLTSASAITKTELRSAIVRNPLIVAPDTTVRDAITQMSALHTQCSTSTRDNHPLDELHLEARSSCVLIAENQKLLGILTERDVVRLSTEKRSLESLPVREVMAHPVVTLYESAFTDLFFVINLLKQHRIRHLPILNDQDQIVGLLTHETLRQTSRPTDLLRLRLVAEVMIANVVSVSPNSPILQIAELMAKHRVSSVVIVQEQDSLFIPIGFVTERDLVQCQALNLDLETCMADQVMNISVFPVRKDHSLWVVQQIMEQHLIRHLVVTGEKGELLGIITQTNILQALNPLELYKLAEVLEQKVSRLEAEKIELLSHRNLELERQVEERTAILKAKAKQEELITNLATQIRSSLNLSEILKTTVEQIRSHLNCDRTVIWQLQTDSSVIVVAEASSSQIEAALIESQNSYITLAAAVPVGIFRTDTQGNCIYVNTSWCSMTGLTPSKAIGGGWTQAIHPQDRDKIVSEWYFAVHENRPFQLEYRYQRPDGLITWVFGQAIVERDINGEIIGYVGTATDITQRKQDSDILENLIEGTSAVTGEDFFPAMAEHISKAFELDRIVITELRNGVFCKLVDFSNHQFQADHVNEDFEELYAKSDLGLALQNQAGESLGYIAIWNNTLKNSSNLGNIIDILRVFATRAEAEIERLRVTEALEQRNQELRQAQSSLEEFNLSLENLVRQQTKEVINLNILQKAILDAADYSIISTDLQGVIQTFNAGAEKMLGYRAEEVIGKVTLARIHDRKELKIYAEILSQELNRPIEQSFEVFIALCKGGIINDQEWIYIRKDGSDFPVSLSINALKDINQQIIGFLAIAKDISQRKQVELERQKLLQELSAFKQGLDQSAIVSITDTKGVIIYVNDRFCEISGYSRDELIGKTHRLINSGYHPSDFFKQLWRTIIQGKVWRGEICNRTRKGDLYWVDSTIVPFLDSYGKPFQYLGIRFDISDRKKIEVELAKSEAQFRGLVEGANDLIWSFDLDGLYTYLSPQFETLFGWKPSEWIGKSFVDLVHPDDLEMLIKNNHQYILAGETSHNLEIRHLHRDGHYLWVRISATAIKNEQGTIIGRQGILSDISDRKQYEVQLQQTNLELARATRMKDEFLANMSHELRTPLNAILGMSEAMQEEIFGPLNQKQHQSVQTIEKSGTHLLALINDILDVAKIESGKIELNCTPTPITELCESSLIFIKQQALKKRISIQTEISPYLPNLLIDERRIRQVLINLLNNAIKFTPEGGGVSLTVKLESSTETALSNHYISFAVTDTGIGIAHENLAKLFQPFVQIDSALNRQYMGTGLGLTLVKKIVEIHGGEVKVKSTIDLGSCFAFRLPCQDLLLKSPQSSQETAVNLDPNSTTQVSEKFPIILLAEDHEANIITISRYLKAKGYQIILAENGQEAIDQAKLHRPDLILMDIQMPVMDGLEAIQRIREDSDLKLANIPIIALTALAMTSDKRKCLEAGANDYLAKPVKLSQLTSTIQEILAQEKN
ncbi:Autoinducer 2 sensor kinase/phosphatase LuxQ [Planktothrix agardhii]|nr:Autoinducer 2 sensor kinase/phosphatase LuxQ [Planktothrix agardhii]